MDEPSRSRAVVLRVIPTDCRATGLILVFFGATPAADVLQPPNVDRDLIPRWSFGRASH